MNFFNNKEGLNLMYLALKLHIVLTRTLHFLSVLHLDPDNVSYCMANKEQDYMNKEMEMKLLVTS